MPKRAQRRVLRLLMKEIGCEESAEGSDDAIQRVNDKLRGEQLLCPYALPEFTWDVTEVKALRDWGDECWSVYHELEDAATGDKSYLRLIWTIAKNRFFYCPSALEQKGNPRIHDVVDLGLKRGMEQLVANVRAKGTQTMTEAKTPLSNREKVSQLAMLDRGIASQATSQTFSFNRRARHGSESDPRKILTIKSLLIN